MKIWLQSGSALTADAATPYGRRYEQSVTRHMSAVARPDTHLETFGIGGTPFGKDRYRASFHVVTSLMIKSVLQAEAKGFDVVAIINTLDHGYYEMRELLDIPVVYISESSMHLACQLAPAFAFVTHNAAMLGNVAGLAKRYGLAERMVAGEGLALTYEDFPKMYEDPDRYVDLFADAARRTIARGAAMLMVAGNPLNMFLIDRGVREVDGVPVLDCCTAVVKAAELMVDLHGLGVRRGSSSAAGTLPSDAKEKLRELFC